MLMDIPHLTTNKTALNSCDSVQKGEEELRGLEEKLGLARESMRREEVCGEIRALIRAAGLRIRWESDRLPVRGEIHPIGPDAENMIFCCEQEQS